MTRFARAKGSKSSNEKVPEEATPWSELKKGIGVKKEELTKETKQRLSALKKKTNEGKPTEWVSLENDCEDPLSILKKHLRNGKEHTKNIPESTGISLPKSDSKKQKWKIEEVDPDEEQVVHKKKKVVDDCNDLSKEACKQGNEVKVENKTDKKLGNKIKKSKKKMKNSMVGISTKKTLIDKTTGKGEKKVKNNMQRDRFTTKIDVGGKIVSLMKFQGYFVVKEDAKRLKELKRKMVAEGIPENEIESAIKLERRRCEKSLARLKANVCFQCRKAGHVLSQCPDLQNNLDTGVGICYKCGSTEHRAFSCKVSQGSNFPFAECFICKEKGHISKQCPDNPRGLYPKGGCCKQCGDVTHLKKDCPTLLSVKEEKTIKLNLMDGKNLEGLEDENNKGEGVVTNKQKKKKLVKF